MRRFARQVFLLLPFVLCLALLPSPHRILTITAQTQAVETKTPIKHLVVIFPENESFDHYFGTYPFALNPPGEPAFIPAPNTPSVNGLTDELLTHNPNLDNPFRLDRLQAPSCFENAEYTPEQEAFDGGLLDRFVQQFRRVDNASTANPAEYCPTDSAGNQDATMGYLDGNTVTALWNYAQYFAMSDNFFDTLFGPSTPGVMHLVAADTAGALCGPSDVVEGDVPACGPQHGPPANSTEASAPAGAGTGTLYADEDPYWDVCSKADASKLVAMSGPNIGDLLNDAGITWGWFQGGFTPAADGKCSASHPLAAFDRAAGIDPTTDPYTYQDYIPHHEPFQYFASTANPQHLPPTASTNVGQTDQANHQYDLSSFWSAADLGSLPSVSFLKPAAYQDSHAGHSDALDEQQFLVETINQLEALPEWSSTAVIIAYDDSDGWYDHVPGPILNHSDTTLDRGCGDANDGAPARCGHGPRLPLLLISPYARQNYISHSLTDQSSITRFIEDNWLGGIRLTAISFDNSAGSLTDLFDFSQSSTRTLFLDPFSGLPVQNGGNP